MLKKILFKILILTSISPSIYAGAVLDIEIGGGLLQTDAPTGTFSNKFTKTNVLNTAKLSSTDDNTYSWLVIDHSIPMLPNIRLEQTALKSIGNNNSIKTTLDMSHSDVIAYWGIPFSTWLPFIDEFDIGAGVKSLDGSMLIANSNSTVYSQSFDGTTIPYAYTKLRIEPGFIEGLGIEAEVKYMQSVNDLFTASINESSIKVDWGIMAPLPIIDMQAGIELGYKSMSLNIDSSEITTDIEFNGIFFGLYGKFGI